MMESWKYIEGYGTRYQVSDKGRVRRVFTKDGKIKYEIKKNSISKTSKYPHVMLMDDEYKYHTATVHRLVATAFIPNPENKPCIDHIDTNKENNCASNLRWVTHKENANNELTIRHSKRHQNITNNIKRLHQSLSIYDRKFYHPVVSVSKSTGEVKIYSDRVTAAKELNLSPSNIWSCINGRRLSCGGYQWFYLKDFNKETLCG